MRILPYESRFRDDLIFMVLLSKDALGRVPRLNEDLLDIEAAYLDKGDMFWLALDENDRVVGSVGVSLIAGGPEAFLHRLYVKPGLKRQGLGSALLETAETWLRSRGVHTLRVHLGEPKEQWAASYAFYPARGFTLTAPTYMLKKL
ncbi:MAG: GNAT family N-acetyltransferase [Clostridia bacterium]|nr:GNAT family N-acetyltransferase [Clostridia bacterium]